MATSGCPAVAQTSVCLTEDRVAAAPTAKRLRVAMVAGDNSSTRSGHSISLREVRDRQSHPHLSEDSAYAALVMRRISPLLTWLVVRYTPLSANSVTSGAIVSGVAAALLLFVPGAVPCLAAVALLQFGFLCDVADGEVARIRGTASRRGQYLDLIGHAFQDRSVYVASAYLTIVATGYAPAAIVLVLIALVFTHPFGIYARGTVLGALNVKDDATHGIRRPVVAPRRWTPATVLYYGYRRAAFLWNYPASMNLFCLAILGDAVRFGMGAGGPLILPAFYLVFGPTRSFKQIANALRLLRSREWEAS